MEIMKNNINRTSKVYSNSIQLGNYVIVDFIYNSVSTQVYPNKEKNTIEIRSSGKDEIICVKIGHKECRFTTEEIYNLLEKEKQKKNTKSKFWSFFKK